MCPECRCDRPSCPSLSAHLSQDFLASATALTTIQQLLRSIPQHYSARFDVQTSQRPPLYGESRDFALDAIICPLTPVKVEAFLTTRGDSFKQDKTRRSYFKLPFSPAPFSLHPKKTR